MAGVDQKQMCSRVDALLSERLAFAQREFTEELWRIGDNFNVKGMLGGSAFHHAVLRLGEAEIGKRANLINNAWREVLNAFRGAAVHVDSGFLSQHAEEKLRESAAQVTQMARSIEKNESAALFVRLEEQLSRSVGSLGASLEILLAELKQSSGVHQGLDPKVPSLVTGSPAEPIPITLYDPYHVRDAKPLLSLISVLGALLGATLLAGGVYLSASGGTADTKIKLFGGELSSTSVGVSLAFLGVTLVAVTFRRVLKSVDYLAALPSSSKRGRRGRKQSGKEARG